MMTALLESLSWWPWAPEAGPIRNVRHHAEAPGMVTLRWSTDDAVPTRLSRADGSSLFQDPDPRTDHQVTLTGWAGMREDIVILAGRVERRVAVSF